MMPQKYNLMRKTEMTNNFPSIMGRLGGITIPSGTSGIHSVGVDDITALFTLEEAEQLIEDKVGKLLEGSTQCDYAESIRKSIRKGTEVLLNAYS